MIHNNEQCRHPDPSDAETAAAMATILSGVIAIDGLVDMIPAMRGENIPLDDLHSFGTQFVLALAATVGFADLTQNYISGEFQKEVNGTHN